MKKLLKEFLLRRTARQRLKIEARIAQLQAELLFWSDRRTPQGTLPQSVCDELAERYGEIASLQVRLAHLKAGGLTPEQLEIRRLRRVLHSIGDSRPDHLMDVEKTPELVEWICNVCHRAKVGAYPGDSEK